MKLKFKSVLTDRGRQIFAFILAGVMLFAAVPFALTIMAAPVLAPSLILFEKNQVKAVLVVREKGDLTPGEYEFITDSAALIRKHFKDATGNDLPQFSQSEFTASPNSANFNGKVKIHLGWNGLDPHPDLAQTLVDLNVEAPNDGNHGYVFAPYGDNVVIQSPTPLGVRYGAAAFLRKYFDVEWLMPGPYGADTPIRKKITIPKVLEFSAPAFNMRYAYCVGADDEWLLNQGLHSHSHTKLGNFSHALCYYFDPNKYFDDHPEYYPIHNGERYRPTNESGWQPRFSEPGTIDVAANEIIELLRNDPDILCVSLGVNDSGGYCEEELAEQRAIHGLNSEGVVHMTDLYCRWCNAVIERVLAEFPGRDIKFGMIAYRQTNDPPKEPGLKFHDSMIPYITKDRLAWVDEEQKAQGDRITSEWLERCSQLGWYNYEYGSAYVVPRIYSTQMQENLQFAKTKDVKYLFSEAMFSVDEGAKPHVFAMLNWDPDCSIRKLERRWYRKAVGAKAAPYLEDFYKLWEEIWTEDIPQSEWFADCKNFTYLQFFYFDYLDGIPLTKLKIARKYLDKALTAVQKSGDENQKKRMDAIIKLYDLDEATALSYPHSYGNLTQAQALKVLKDGYIDRQLEMKNKSLDLYNSLLGETDILLDYLLAFEYMFEEAPLDDSLNPAPFWAIVDYIKENEPAGGPITNRVSELAASTTPSYAKKFSELVLSYLNGNNLIQDPSFEEGTLGELNDSSEPWTAYGEGIGTLTRIENPAFAKTGSRSIRADNNRPWSALAQAVPVKPGLFTFRIHYYTTPSSRPDAGISLLVNLLDSEGNIIKANHAVNTKYGLKTSPGNWLTREIAFEVPETVDGQRVSYVHIWAGLAHQNDVPLYWDDAEAYQAP